MRFCVANKKCDILMNELRVDILASCVYCTGCDILINSYELISLRVAFMARVTSYNLFLTAPVTCYFLHTSYELLLFRELRVTFIPWITSYFYCTSCKLLFIAQVTSCFSHTNYELIFLTRVTSYVSTTSYNKNKDDKAVDDNKVMIKNYTLGLIFDTELRVR